MVKAVFNVVEFAKSMLYNCIKVVRLKPGQPNQWLRACVPSTVNASHEPIAVSTGNNSIQQCYLKFIPMYNYYLL